MTLSAQRERTITADAGKVFRRIHDRFQMGDRISLGYDYSTGRKRLDVAEHYEQIDDPDAVTDTDVRERLNEGREATFTTDEVRRLREYVERLEAADSDAEVKR